jgi:glycosyltransferase involved in cell wall biosynthesis
MAKVSVVIPTYNMANHICDTIDCVLNQSFQDHEIIVVDDGSEDNTKNILMPYINGEKIKYIYQQNKGVSSARNKGLNLANGEYVAFLDADDKWDKDFLFEMVTLIEKGLCDWAICDNYHVELDINGKEISRVFVNRPHILENTKELFFLLLEKDLIGGPSKVLAKKECFLSIGGFDEKLRMREDWDIWIRMSKFNLGLLDKPLFFYYARRDGTNITRRCKNLWVYETFKLLTKYRYEYKRSPTLRQIYAKYLWDLARELFYQKKDYSFMAYLMFKSHMTAPSWKRFSSAVSTNLKYGLQNSNTK